MTPADIATRLGRTLSSAETAQVQAWIDDADFLIKQRVDMTTVDPLLVEYVITQAVMAVASQPRPGVVQETVTVDDATVSERYARATQRVSILPEWWTLLGVASGKAFAVDMVARPSSIHAPWCALNFGATYCSCGADLAGYSIFESYDL